MIDVREKVANLKRKGQEIWRDHRDAVLVGCGAVGAVVGLHVLRKIRGEGTESFDTGRHFNSDGSFDSYWVQVVKRDRFGIPFRTPKFHCSEEMMRGISKAVMWNADHPDYDGEPIEF